MLYELDFLPVGEGESSGDAICLRYSTDEGNTWHVGVIDGGTQTSGEALCEHIKSYYGTETVDFLVCSHPDQDHASGLSVVLENLTVNKVLMHCPWDYVDQVYEYVTDGRVTKESLKRRLIEGHPYAYKVYELATSKGIPIHHAFSDLADHNIPCLHILGPSINFYVNQLKNFRSITDVTEDESAFNSLLKGFFGAAQKAINYIAEAWDDETLVDPAEDATSSENNSSVVICFDFDGKKHLFTGDAGVSALDLAATRMEELGLPLQNFSMVQAPHHGSKRNVGPTVLNRLLGAPPLFQQNPTYTCIISASKEGEPKHPNKRVSNAFARRGASVVATKGITICHSSSGVPHRGWSAVTPLPFYNEVEEDD